MMGRVRWILVWAMASTIGCADAPPPPAPPPAGPLAITGWAGGFAADADRAMVVIRRSPAWLHLARGRARSALDGFREAAPTIENRIGRWRAAGAVADALDVLARGLRAVADRVVDRQVDAARRASWEAYLGGHVDRVEPGVAGAVLGAAILASLPPSAAVDLGREICPDRARAPIHRLLACALVDDGEAGLSAADEVDWVELAERGRRSAAILPVDPAPVVALARLYRAIADAAACDPPAVAQICDRRDGTDATAPTGASADVEVAIGLFAPPDRSLTGRDIEPVAFAGLLRRRRDRHRAWLDDLPADRRRVLERYRAVDEALCADLLGEARARLIAGRASHALALLRLFPRSTCGAVHGSARVPSGLQSALRYASAVAVDDPQTAYATADARGAVFDAEDGVARGPWHLAAQACRWWHFSRDVRPAPPLPSE